MTIVAATGRGVPSGSNTYVQYNDNGVFGADANLTWNKTDNILNTGRTIFTNNNSSQTIDGTKEHVRYDNTGTYSLVGHYFSSVAKYVETIHNTGTVDAKSAGSSAGFVFQVGTAMNSLASAALIYSAGILTNLNVYAGQKVTAGNADTASASTFSNYGSSANKGTFVTATTYNLADEKFVYADPSNATICSGTPSAACSSYGSEGTCNTHSAAGCSWNAGVSCSEFNGNQSSCESQSPCVFATASCLGPTAEGDCLAQDDSYGGSCSWSIGNACSGFVSEGTCEAQSGCTWDAIDCGIYDATSQGTCEGASGCTWDLVSCLGPTDETTCTDQDNVYGGTCSWSTGNDCSGFASEGTCTPNFGCTWNAGDCSAFNGTDQGTCEGFAGCTWDYNNCLGPTDQYNCELQDDAWGGSCSWSTGNNCNTLFFDEYACNSQSGCSWDGFNCNGTFDYCTGTYYINTCSGSYTPSCSGSYSYCDGTYYNGNCSGTGPGACTGTYSFCDGTYYTGSCTGVYGSGCEGTALCSNISSSGPCASESGCSWITTQTLTLPSVDVINRSQTSREYSILHVGTAGTVSIVPYSGDTIYQHGSSIILTKPGDRVWLHQHNLYSDCSTFVSEETCIPSGCSWSEGACSGTYTSAKSWFVHNLERGPNYVSKTANYTATYLDDVINVTANSIAITLPDAVTFLRKEFTIKNRGAGTVTLNTTTSQTVDGSGSGVITLAAGKAIQVVSDGANWIIVSRFV